MRHRRRGHQRDGLPARGTDAAPRDQHRGHRLEEPIVDSIQLGFDHKLHQGNIPVVKDCEGYEVPRRHDSTISRCYSYSLPLHHASPEIQLAAMPHLNALFELVLEKAEAIATALDEARGFDCMGQCCPFISGSRCC
jgi:hypothetical protein